MSLLNNFDHKDRAVDFFAISLGAVAGGLFLGAVVDAAVRKLQRDGDWKERHLGKSAAYFVLQCSLNITILLLLTRFISSFHAWLQLSLAGALFSVLLFTAQRNLVDNALRLTNF